MKKLIVNGAEQLYGEVSAGGAKNAAVAIIPATVLARGRCVLENVPDIHDTELLFSMLRAMGATVEKLSRTSAIIDTSTLTESTVPYELSKHMRASYYFIGSLLGRFGPAGAISAFVPSISTSRASSCWVPRSASKTVSSTLIPRACKGRTSTSTRFRSAPPSMSCWPP